MIGVFGGTFDPVHFGHLRAALELQQTLGLKEIRFIPCRQPVHKAPAIASPQQRLRMLQLAVQNQPGFVVDDQEIQRNSPSYMIETLRYLQQTLPSIPLGLIIGSDALTGFPQWKDWQEILSIARLLIMPRQLLISSSAIRQEISAGKSARFLLPDTVWEYIQQQQLYR